MAEQSLNLESVRLFVQPGAPWGEIFNILNGYLQPNSPDSALTAEVKIDSLTPMNRGPNNHAEREQFLWYFWELFIEFARAIPHDHQSQEKLVLLVKTLAQKKWIVVKIKGKNARFWTDLPLLLECMEEVRYNPERDQPLCEQSAMKSIRWTSLAARLQGAELVSWEIFALWALRDALETTNVPRPVLSYYVTVAAEWIIHSGRALFACLDFKQLDGDTNNGTLYWGRTGLSRERWGFWKTRFDQVRDSIDVVAGARATIALETMNAMGEWRAWISLAGRER